MKYNKRLENPSVTNGWFHSPSLNIYAAKGIGSCTQYAFGRLSEILNKKIGYKDTWYPIDLYNRCAEAGFAKSDKIGLGFGAVWQKLDGSGSHISIVEELHGEDGKCSMWDINSNFVVHEIRKADGYKYRIDDYRFVGFIDIKAVFESETEDYSKNAIQNRFIVMKNGKQDNCYTNWGYATARANKIGGVIVDRNTGKQIYPEVTTAPAQTESAKPVTPVKKELTATSYPDYTGGGFYRVRKSFTDEKSSMGSFSIWKYAFNKWTIYRGLGYHIYDKEGNQLD